MVFKPEAAQGERPKVVEGMGAVDGGGQLNGKYVRRLEVVKVYSEGEGSRC